MKSLSFLDFLSMHGEPIIYLPLLRILPPKWPLETTQSGLDSTRRCAFGVCHSKQRGNANFEEKEKKEKKTRTTSFHRAVSFHSRPLSGNLKACPAPTTKRHLSRKDLSTPKTNMLKYKHKKGNRREPASRNRKQPQSTLSSRLVQPGGGSGSARSGTL